MGRQIKSGLDYFPFETSGKLPNWNPQYYTKRRFLSEDFKERYKALKNSSASFISREDVREYLLKKGNYKCDNCENCENLEIDHKISILHFAQNKLQYELLNKEENLQILCKSCNCKKAP